MTVDRRRFLSTSLLSTGFLIPACTSEDPGSGDQEGQRYGISLAQWSMHRALKGGDLDNLDWPAHTRETFDIHALEWVNQFFHKEHPTLGYQPRSADYISEMKKRCDDEGMKSLLIMCDRVGQLGNPDNRDRTAAIEGHYAWLDAASTLGCHSIRVNAASDPELSPERQADLCADGLRRLSEKAAEQDLNVIVENHGGLSSNGAWLARVLSSVNLDNCGSLPDFGNFYVVGKWMGEEKYAEQKELHEGDPALTEDEKGLAYDRYLGVRELMPYAKGVSAKSHDFDEEGDEVHTDFGRMMDIVVESGYEGYIGIEYEGSELGEEEGIRKTKTLLERSIPRV